MFARFKHRERKPDIPAFKGIDIGFVKVVENKRFVCIAIQHGSNIVTYSVADGIDAIFVAYHGKQAGIRVGDTPVAEKQVVHIQHDFGAEVIADFRL